MTRREPGTCPVESLARAGRASADLQRARPAAHARRLVAGAAVWLAAGLPAGAQDHADYEPADIAYGQTVYARECAVCHAEDGAGIAGVDLRNGPLRRGSTDRGLRQVIRLGIPESGMLAFDFDAAEMTGIVAYLRNMNYEADAPALGDPARGRAVFAGAGDCLRCHRVGAEGPRLAVDLTSIGARRAASALRRTLLDPSGTMRPIDRPITLVTADGETITGRRLNEDTYTVQVIDDAGRLRSFDKADLQRFDLSAESPMPAFGERLAPEELADLLAYLMSLKG
ncbi:MAG: c-type cytochrome [Acidobacteria bacterium]|nr:c-type cytochrome [Acidobacteriota bacterium]